jgi:hypothetical protein
MVVHEQQGRCAPDYGRAEHFARMHQNRMAAVAALKSTNCDFGIGIPVLIVNELVKNS